MRADLFSRLLGAALVALVVTDAANGVWRIHAGEVYAWRHLPGVPLYPTWALAIEWAVLAGAGAALILRGFRVATWVAWIAAPVLFVSLLERYANGRALIFIAVFFVAIRSLELCRWQVIVVYLFSVLAKLLHGFLGGEMLVTLGARVRHQIAPDAIRDAIFSPSAAPALAVTTIVLELAIPILLIFRPRTGFALACALHAAFALLMPGLWPFSVAMVALASLWMSPLARQSG